MGFSEPMKNMHLSALGPQRVRLFKLAKFKPLDLEAFYLVFIIMIL